jgi:hypothetical protein
MAIKGETSSKNPKTTTTRMSKGMGVPQRIPLAFFYGRTWAERNLAICSRHPRGSYSAQANPFVFNLLRARIARSTESVARRSDA